MTAGNNGADTPENDDPFAHLYRSEGGEGGSGSGVGAARQPGVPRTSYNQVRAVGERQYGNQQGPPAYNRPNPTYAAPETLPGNGGGDRTRPAPAYGQEPRKGRNGLLIGAVAVVAVVCIGIGVAMLTNSKDSTSDTADKSGPTAGDSVKPSDSPSTKPSPGQLPKDDAGALRLDGGATTAKDIPGARTASGSYVTNMNNPGAAATWTLDVPKSGDYTVFIGYGVPGKEANSTLTVNGNASPRPINMGNFANAADGDWAKGWTRTFSWIQLNKGTNTIKISCEQNNKCDFNLDQVWLKAGHVKN
ncbi:CBM35 domain-containing protein [Streptomyces sp. NPDC057743]|uniref:CBM35 domain-containing protein n=1 Tax=Streptomyces sp. NPDC057743 TaxID=3346236 RepID=UPI00368F4969